MRRRTKLALGVAAVPATLLVLVLVGVLVLTQSDWGRERVRRLALGQLTGSVNGVVEIGRVSGNLLSGATLTGVTITDSAGAPFLRADTVSLDYSLRSLLSQRIYLSDVRLVRPRIVLDKRPGEEWNFARIFPSDTTAVDPTARGFGSWVRIAGLSARDGRLLVRNEWTPGDTLSGPARDSAIAVALSEENRLRVVRVPGGYQSIQDFRELNTRMPLLRLADPDSTDMLIEVASLSTEAYLFRPPAAQVRDLSGRFVVSEDSLRFQNVQVVLPESRLTAQGVFLTGVGDLRATLAAAPVSLGDLQWLYPALPDSGGGSVQLAVAREGERTHVVARELDLRVEDARLVGSAEATVGDSLRLGPTDLRVENFDTRLIQRFVPDAEVPVDGVLNGRVALTGTPSALDVDGRLAFTERGGETSRIVADGEIGTGDGFRARDLRIRLDPVRVALARTALPDLPLGGTITGQAILSGSATTGFDIDAELVHQDPRTGRSRLLADGEIEVADGFAARDLRLRFDPLRVALAKAFAPDLPVGGTISGRATVNGSADTRLVVDTDLVHRDTTGLSRLVGDVAMVPGEVQHFDADLRALPVSLRTVGRFAPAAGLRGSATGVLSARGTPGDLALALNFAIDGGGSIDAQGTADLASPRQSYDLRARFTDFDAGALSTQAPSTRLSGTVAARGIGTDPAALDAVLSADLVDTQLDSIGVDAARVLVRIANGLATVERGTVRLASAAAELGGSFGLTGDRSGELRYRISVDSLSDFAEYLPADTAAPPPGPSAPPPPGAGEQGSRGAAVPADSLAGSIRLAGTVAGNLEQFDLRGTAELDDVVAAGNALASGRAEYTWLGAPDAGASLALDAALDSVRAGGFALDSVSTRVRYREGPRQGVRGGTADLAIYQDTDHDYRLRADYQLATDANEVRLSDVLLRFDDTRWTSAQPAVVRWGGDGVGVEALELRDGADGRIYADGRLPAEGADGDLEIVIERLQVGDIAALLQDTAQASGLLSLRADVAGSLRDPRFQAETRLVEARYGETALPVLQAAFGYADAELETRAELRREGGETLMIAEGRVPLDLAVGGQVGERLLDRPMTFDIRADSLPLDALPEFPDAATDLRGYVTGVVAVRGTPQAPEVDGTVDLDNGSVNLVQPGLALRDVAGALRIQEDAVIVDSLVARSGDGPIRLSGVLDISAPAEPGFDLEVTARGAEVLSNEMGEAYVDADLDVAGPFEAVRVTGDIDVREGVFYIPEMDEGVIDLEDPELATLLENTAIEPEVLPELNPLLAGLQVDVGIRISRNTWARNAEANVELYTPEEAGPLQLQLDQQERTLVLEGAVNTDRGEYNFAGRRFQIEGGSVVFLGSPELNPLLQLTAEYEVPRPTGEALAILINIGGTLVEPTVALESNAQPPLSQSDLISYLALGRSSSSLLPQGGSGVTGGGGGGNLPALVTQKLTGLALGAMVEDVVNDLESGGMRDLGLDVFRISPAELPSEVALDGAVNLLRGTELEVGKYLSSRIFVAGQGRPTTEAWPGIRVEYRTPTGFRWITTWEPRFLPSQPTLSPGHDPVSTNVFGAFLRWERRF